MSFIQGGDHPPPPPPPSLPPSRLTHFLPSFILFSLFYLRGSSYLRSLPLFLYQPFHLLGPHHSIFFLQRASKCEILFFSVKTHQFHLFLPFLHPVFSQSEHQHCGVRSPTAIQAFTGLQPTNQQEGVHPPVSYTHLELSSIT